MTINRRLAFVFAALVMALGVSLAMLRAQELVNLTAPETKPSNNQYQIERLTLDVLGASITVQMRGQNGETLQKVYNGQTVPTGLTLLTALNKANLSTRSLKQRIFDQLIADGVLVGTVAGSVP